MSDEAPINIDRKRNAQWLEGAAHGAKTERDHIRKQLERVRAWVAEDDAPLSGSILELVDQLLEGP